MTNAEFAEFVDATGYVTVAERPLNPADYPDAPAENLQPGSMVFTRTQGPVDLRHLSQWWAWTPGASWRHPVGPHSSVDKRADHPVVHVALRGCRGLCAVGGSRAADRGASGRSRPAAASTRDLHMGRRTRAARPTAGQLLARRLPMAARNRATAAPHRSAASRPTATACSTWRATSGNGPPTGTPTRARRPVLRGGQLRPAAAAVPGAAQGHQGRLVSVRRQLLPALPARSPQTADGRHRHEPHRISLRDAGAAGLGADGQASAAFLIAASVAGIPLLAASLRCSIWASASAP